METGYISIKTVMQLLSGECPPNTKECYIVNTGKKDRKDCKMCWALYLTRAQAYPHYNNKKSTPPLSGAIDRAAATR